jgi:hypothetical protein
MVSEDDPEPYDLSARIYDRMCSLIDQWEEMNIRERIATLTAISRIQIAFDKLKSTKESNGRDQSAPGSAVKRYERAFQANAARRRDADDFDIDEDDDELRE